MNQCLRPSTPGRTHQSPINHGQVREHSFLSTGKSPIVALKVSFLSGKWLYLMETDVTPQNSIFLYQEPRSKIFSTNTELENGCLCVFYILKSVSFLQWSILFLIENFYSTRLNVPIKNSMRGANCLQSFLEMPDLSPFSGYECKF